MLAVKLVEKQLLTEFLNLVNKLTNYSFITAIVCGLYFILIYIYP
jgi:hypothetical protein